MAIYQLVFWLAVLVLCAGVGVGGMYFFYAREKANRGAPSWESGQPPHRTEAH
ncbi:MAG: hypothetical protein ABIR26_01120 [Ramlibacter sp.]